MAAATSATAVVNGFTSPFLSGGKKSSQSLFVAINNKVGAGAGAGAGISTTRRVVVAAAAAPKKSWIPAVKGGGNFVDPEWLDGSYVNNPLLLLFELLLAIASSLLRLY